MKRSHSFRRCIICGAKNDGDNKRYFSFPKDPDRKRLWLQNLGRIDMMEKKIPQDLRVCSLHFTEEVSSLSRRKLRKWDVPVRSLEKSKTNKSSIQEEVSLQFVQTENMLTTSGQQLTQLGVSVIGVPGTSENSDQETWLHFVKTGKEGIINDIPDSNTLIVPDIDEQLKQQQQNSQSGISNSLSSSLSLDVPSNFCQIQPNASSSSQQHYQHQQHQEQQTHYDSINHIEYSKTLPSFENMIIPTESRNQKSAPTQSSFSIMPSSSKNTRKQSRRKRRKNRVKSNKALSATCYLLQNEIRAEKSNNYSENSLKSFGDFIDAELEKFDDNLLAVVKLKINKILHEAALGLYKNANIKTDGVDDCNSRSSATDENDSETESGPKSRKRQRKNSKDKNKENRVPSISVLQHRDSLRTEKNSNQQEAGVNVHRKRRLKTKKILSAVYDALISEFDDVEPRISFGAYVCNELKIMDNETIKNAKLNICRVLYEASMEKYRRAVDQLSDMPEEDSQLKNKY